MRLKSEAVLSFGAFDEGQPKIVLQAHQRYKAISQVLDEHPMILDRVHRDLKRVLSTGKKEKGRRSGYTSETILRALIVRVLEGDSFRDVVVRLADNEFLSHFCRLGCRSVMDFTFLNKCFNAIRPKTWKRINEALAQSSAEQGRIDPSVIRTDSTVTEANIHYPTDSSLLWDSWRVLSRRLREARALAPGLVPHRFHDAKVKKLHLFITRYASSRAKSRQRKVKSTFRKLIGKVRDVVSMADSFCELATTHYTWCPELEGLALGLRDVLPTVRTVVETAERAQIQGETVPAKERVFSIFEPHVELIKRGKRAKPVEFGHRVVLSQTREKFVTDYDVMERQLADAKSTKIVVAGHEALFGLAPRVVAADQGFNPEKSVRRALEDKVETLAIPRCLSDWGEPALAAFQRFRAGIEGSISVLKRVFGLMRCLFKGFRHFASAVGFGVLCHNLVVLAGCQRE